jgi:hypothetical protein
VLFAALNVLDGQIIAQCQQRHRRGEWLKFLRQIEREGARGERVAFDRRQLRRPQALGRAEAARQTSALKYALHADPGLVDEHGRGLRPPLLTAQMLFSSIAGVPD